MLRACIDDSVSDDRLIVGVGGWLCSGDLWDGAIEPQWNKRIAYENAFSERHGFPTISRYHAADCSSLLNEFDRSKGWDNERQKRFVKKLIEIMVKKRREPIFGFAVAGSMDNYRIAYKSRRRAEKNLVRGLLVKCGMLIGDAMAKHWPGEKVSIFYDHSMVDSAAQAFATLKANDCPYQDIIVTMAPVRWQDCLLLQPADMLAYDGQKAGKTVLKTPIGNRSKEQLQAQYRRSLLAMIGGHAIMQGEFFTDFFQNILDWRDTQGYKFRQ